MTTTPIRLRHASTFVSRLAGLLTGPPLQAREALWIRPCSSVHTCFMRYAIDVVFLDKALQVVGIRQRLLPWRAAWARGAHSVLELPAGSARAYGFFEGQQLSDVLSDAQQEIRL